MTTVRTQSELDAAIAAGDTEIVIRSPRGVWLEVGGSASVRAFDSASVRAFGSASVWAGGSASVWAFSSASVWAGSYVAVHLHSQHVKLAGGVVIDMTAVDELDPAAWCDLHGVDIKRGKAQLFKAVDDEYAAGHAHIRTVYRPGTKITATDWADSNQCGGGLHLCPTADQATSYHESATRWVRCEVPVRDLRPILGCPAKAKVKTLKVVAEVDRFGREVAHSEVSA